MWCNKIHERINKGVNLNRVSVREHLMNYIDIILDYFYWVVSRTFMRILPLYLLKSIVLHLFTCNRKLHFSNTFSITI